VILVRRVTVPIDMSSEQKTILGIMSKRQLIYLIVGGAILYVWFPFIFKLFPNLVLGFIFSVVFSLPIIGAVFVLGFTKKRKHALNYDHYLLIKVGYKKQLGIWRKGKYPKEWMVRK